MLINRYPQKRDPNEDQETESFDSKLRELLEQIKLKNEALKKIHEFLSNAEKNTLKRKDNNP